MKSAIFVTHDSSMLEEELHDDAGWTPSLATVVLRHSSGEVGFQLDGDAGDAFASFAGNCVLVERSNSPRWRVASRSELTNADCDYSTTFDEWHTQPRRVRTSALRFLLDQCSAASLWRHAESELTLASSRTTSRRHCATCAVPAMPLDSLERKCSISESYLPGDSDDHVVIQEHSAGHQVGESGVDDQRPRFDIRAIADSRNGKVAGTNDHCWW
jgi:hypothetical protein